MISKEKIEKINKFKKENKTSYDFLGFGINILKIPLYCDKIIECCFNHINNMENLSDNQKVLLSVGKALENIKRNQEKKRENCKKIKIAYVALDQFTNSKRKNCNSNVNSISTKMRSKSTVKSTSNLNKPSKIKIKSLPRLEEQNLKPIMPNKSKSRLFNTPNNKIKILPPISDNISILEVSEEDTKHIKSNPRRALGNNDFRILRNPSKHRSVSYRK